MKSMKSAISPLKLTPAEVISAGEVGYVGAIIKKVGSIHVGDTIISPTIPEPKASRFKTHPANGFLRYLSHQSNDYIQTDCGVRKICAQ